MSKRNQPDCSICIESISPSRVVKCPFCDYVSCRKCFERYLTTSVDDPHCMNCNRSYDREIMSTLNTKTFLNTTYKKFREGILCEREMSMMPSTQPHVEQELQRRKNMDLLCQIQKERIKLKNSLRELNRSYDIVQSNLVPDLDKFEDRKTFVHKCSSDNCLGFLSTQWKCNICQNYTCSQCNATIGLDRNHPHVCDESSKKTMEMLKSDSKNCPGCGECIFKVSGCDQMWCVSCHTAFSWKTGRKVNGTIHNPHFYQFMQTHGHLGRQLNDIPCGGLPSFREIHQFLSIPRNNGRMSLEVKTYEFVTRYHRIVGHVQNAELPRFPTTVLENANKDLRILFMLKELSEDEFKRKLQQREKLADKRREIGLILNMFIDTSSDAMRQMVQDSFEQLEAKHIHVLRSLIEYTNNSMSIVSKRFDCTVPIIDMDRGFVSSRKF